jgi:hypothetical protein
VALPGVSANDVTANLENAILAAAKKSRGNTEIATTRQQTTVIGQMKMNTPFHIIRTLQFTLQVQSNGQGYAYQIDIVLIAERRRGGKETVKRLKELTGCHGGNGNSRH